MSLEAAQVAAMLNETLSYTLSHLLGDNGKKAGNQLCFGDSQGNAGQSCKINLSGPHAGTWRDWATDEHGDLLDLWAYSRNLTTAEAMKEAMAWLGVKETRVELETIKMKFTKPPPISGVLAISNSRARNYLLETRGLTEDAVKAYMVCYDPASDALAFPYLTTAGASPVRYKYLHLERTDGKKNMWSSKNPEPCLFGWQAIPPVCREVVITEGEIDSMSVYSLGTGHYGLSLPNGSGDLSWIGNDYERLASMDIIYLMLDNDEAGQAHIPEIVERIGAHRCRIVQIPNACKDCNDYLLAPGLKGFAQLLVEAKSYDPAEVVMMGDIKERVLALMADGFDNGPAIEMPFQKLHGKLRLRPTEVSLLTGINGHGKTEMSTQIALSAIQQGHKVCVASLEWTKERFMQRALRQAAGMDGGDDISQEFAGHILDYYAEKLILFGTTGTAKFGRVMYIMEHIRKRYGVELFIIDNLAKLGIGEDDYNGQKDVVDRLTDFVNTHNCHVMLIAHDRKGMDESHIPGKMDVKGTGALTDMVKTVLSVWRRKEKEAATACKNAGWDLNARQEKVLGMSDAVLRCSKQNGGEWEGDCALFFNNRTHQYTEGEFDRPKQYVGYSNQES